MTLVAILAVVSAVGVTWSVILLRRARDWTMRILIMMLGLMPIYQTIAAAVETGLWHFSEVAQLRMLFDLIINVLFLLAIFLLEFAIDERHKANVQLRVMEAAIPAGGPGLLSLHPLKPQCSPSDPAVAANGPE